jgi:hypothetical protein
MLRSIYQIMWCNIPEDTHLHFTAVRTLNLTLYHWMFSLGLLCITLVSVKKHGWLVWGVSKEALFACLVHFSASYPCEVNY